MARATTRFGPVEIRVAKERFFPATANVDANEMREFVIRVALQPQGELEETVTVSSTRTDTRLQDTPTHVEVVQRDEIEEEITMKPGDMVMLLNEMGGMR